MGRESFTGLSLESSQRCNLRCPHCVMRTYEHMLEGRDMDPDVVRAVIPFIGGLDSVDFTGWGEPLLNPSFGEILSLVRAGFKGRMSFTTNGLLFDGKMMDACIDNQVDIICFSTDAVDKRGYSRMRPGGGFGGLMKVIRRFVSRKGGRSRPGLYATYLLQRRNLEGAAAFVRMSRDLGMDGVVFQLMTGVHNEDARSQVTYSNYYETDFNEEQLREALAKAVREAPPDFTVVIPEMVQPEPVCNCGGFDITRPFVSASGDVTLCCAMAYPVELMERDGSLRRRRPRFFGNVLEAPLPEIWSGPEYVSVREKIFSGEIPEACGDCIGLYIRLPGGGRS